MPLSLKSISERTFQLGVVGLGYVGYPLSLAFVESDISVLGFDIDAQKVHHINEGTRYFQHIEEHRVQQATSSGLFHATTDHSRAAECDAILICVPTPLTSQLKPNLQFIEHTCSAIAPYLQPHTLVSLESTTYPGTTEEVIKPLLESSSGLFVGKDLYLCFSPEREDPGNREFRTQAIPKLVGAGDERSLELAVALYGTTMETIIPLSSAKVAEAAKLLESTFRSVNIALVNELKMAFESMGIDISEVIRAASTKPFGFMPFWPGPGSGGHCIPVDPYYLTWKAKKSGFHPHFIEMAGEINRKMPRWVVGKVREVLRSHQKDIKEAKILILGLAYKPDVDDVRESPSRELIRLLEREGAYVDYHDPLIPEIGPSRNYPELEGKKSSSPSKHYDCFVLATHHSCFELGNILIFEVPVVDTRHALPNDPLVYRA